MQINYTSKLFFKKYAYKVVLSCQTTGRRWTWRSHKMPQEFQSVQDWCEAHAAGQFHISRRYQGGSKKYSDWHQNVYLQSADHKDALIKHQAASVHEVWQPLDSDHLQSLDVRNVIEVRDQLIYRKYAHVIYFKYDAHGELWNWLETLMEGSQVSVLKGSTWWPKVYSSDLDDVRMIQLSYPERIDYIKHVKLLTGSHTVG